MIRTSDARFRKPTLYPLSYGSRIWVNAFENGLGKRIFKTSTVVILTQKGLPFKKFFPYRNPLTTLKIKLLSYK